VTPTSVSVYLTAADALVTIGASFEADDWAMPSACPGWNAVDVAGHVLCVARWHHRWLDRAVAGNTAPPWPPGELAVRNQAALERLDIVDGPTRLAAFSDETHRYASRLATAWTLPFWYPGGLVTVGVHALLAAGEWQLHAWDLGVAAGIEHVADAAPIRDTWVELGRDISRNGDPWKALLLASGRSAR
jgi:uncharacterized protein (TIGR03083 family)